MGIEDMTGKPLIRNGSIRRVAVCAMVVLALALGGCGITKSKTKSTPTVGNRIPILSRIEAGTKVDAGMSGREVVLPAAQANPDGAQAGGTASTSAGHLALSTTSRSILPLGSAKWLASMLPRAKSPGASSRQGRCAAALRSRSARFM